MQATTRLRPQGFGVPGGLGRRVKKVDKDSDPDVEYSYYYNTSWQVLEVRRKVGTNDPTVHKQYVWDLRYIDAPVLRWWDTNTDGTVDETLYYTNDPPSLCELRRAGANMNSSAVADKAEACVTALVDTDGDVVERYSYDPYGRVTFRKPDFSKTDGPDGQPDTADDGTAGEFDNAILYAGYLYDDETGLFHVRNRTYHPTLGRWLQRDPKDAGVPGGGYHDGMNCYEYGHSSPIRAVDPEGTRVECPDELSIQGYRWEEVSRPSDNQTMLVDNRSVRLGPATDADGGPIRETKKEVEYEWIRAQKARRVRGHCGRKVSFSVGFTYQEGEGETYSIGGNIKGVTISGAKNYSWSEGTTTSLSMEFGPTPCFEYLGIPIVLVAREIDYGRTYIDPNYVFDESQLIRPAWKERNRELYYLEGNYLVCRRRCIP